MRRQSSKIGVRRGERRTDPNRINRLRRSGRFEPGRAGKETRAVRARRGTSPRDWRTGTDGTQKTNALALISEAIVVRARHATSASDWRTRQRRSLSSVEADDLSRLLTRKRGCGVACRANAIAADTAAATGGKARSYSSQSERTKVAVSPRRPCTFQRV
jgi:hypothetical protein